MMPASDSSRPAIMIFRVGPESRFELPLIKKFSDDGVPAAEQPLVSESWYQSDGEPFVAIMQLRSSTPESK